MALIGLPPKPQTTQADSPGGAGAWMWAIVRLSFGSAVCVPVTSMLLTVAVQVSEVPASFSSKVDEPNDLGRGSPAAVVGSTGKGSWKFVRSAVRMVLADALPVAATTASRASEAVHRRPMGRHSLRGRTIGAGSVDGPAACGLWFPLGGKARKMQATGRNQ